MKELKEIGKLINNMDSWLPKSETEEETRERLYQERCKRASDQLYAAWQGSFSLGKEPSRDDDDYCDEPLSECCGAPIHEEGELCSECLEHC